MGINKGPTRVIQFTECWLPLTEIWLYKHLRALSPDIESGVVCQYTQNLEEFSEDNCVSLNRPPVGISMWNRGMRRLGLWDDRNRHLALLDQTIRDRKPHVLHSHFGQYGWFNSKLAEKHKLPHVVSFYGFDVGYLPKGDSRWFARYREMGESVDQILCEGPHMAQCISRLGIDASKIKVFRLGIDLELIPFVPRSNPAGKEKLRFLIVGSFREKKGIPYAIQALGRFHKSFPNIEISIIGDGGKDYRAQSEKQKIMDAVQQGGLSDKVIFLGYRPYEYLRQAYLDHHIFISPSVTAADGDTEGGAPVTIIEAAASGMPVVSTTHCDIPYMLSDENRPYLAPERDVDALVVALEALISTKDWGPIVSANRRLVEKELDVKCQGLKLAEIYRKTASSRKTPQHN